MAIDVATLLRDWSRVGRTHSKEDLASLSAVSCVAMSHMKEEVAQLIAAAEGRPLMVSYMSDGTPIVTRHQLKNTADPGQRAPRRSARTMDEFLCQCLFYTYIDAMGHRQVKALVPDARPMTNGKTSVALLSFFLESFVNPRTHGHSGIVLLHATFDRAPFDSLTRLMNQYFTFMAPEVECTDDSGESHDPLQLFLLFWMLKTPCAYHDTHKSFQWAMHGEFNDQMLIDDVYIGIASCCNSAKQILDQMGPWIADVLTPTSLHELPSADSLRELWTCLDQDPAIVEEIVDLHLVFRDGRLCFADCVPLGTVYSRVAQVLFAVWKLRTFSTSRWITIGPSCRRFVGSLLLGLESVVRGILADGGQSHYKISGYSKMTIECKQFVAVAALASYPADGVCKLLMKDNRVVKVLDELKATAQSNAEYLCALSDSTWSSVGSVCDLTGPAVRDKVLGAAHKSIVFMQWRIFDEATRLPWKLMLGDIDANLRDLQGGPEPAEPTSANIHRLLSMGWNKAELKQALRLAFGGAMGD